jgi:small subunit ribosomal protein S2
MSYVTMKELLEAGVHFGHQTRRWNPKMAPYIFGARNGIHIIDLQKTVQFFKTTYNYVVEQVADGGIVLFVGTRSRRTPLPKRPSAAACSASTTGGWEECSNFQTINRSIKRLKEFEAMKKRVHQALSKRNFDDGKEGRQAGALLNIKNMSRLPDIVYIVDPQGRHCGGSGRPAYRC